MVFGELVAGAGFGRDRLYVEWRLQSPGAEEGDEPGVIKVSAELAGRLVRGSFRLSWPLG